MNFKRFIYNRLFNERQREAIWQAVLFSEHTYKRRGNVDGAAAMRQVINEVVQTAATKQKVFLESQVHEIVIQEVDKALKGAQEKVENAYREGKAAGVKKAIDEMKQYVNEELKKIGIYLPSAKDVDDNSDVHFIKGMKIDRNKCDKCEHKDECFVKAAIDEIENDSEEDNEPESNVGGDSSETAETEGVGREIPVVGAEEAKDTDVADAPEVDEDREEDKDKG